MLVAMYRDIARTRMQGLPMVNTAMQVEAVGFAPFLAAEAPEPSEPPEALGVLVTPWFMNLVWLPLARVDLPERQGCKLLRQVGSLQLEGITGHADALGNYHSCSLFSPMFDFADQATALATASAVLSQLRQASDLTPPATPPITPPTVPARRAFLLGRAASSPAVQQQRIGQTHHG